LIPGDYNADDWVDGADLLLWQRRLGSPANPSGSGADGNDNGVVDAADLAVWKSRFGDGPADGAVAILAAAIASDAGTTSDASSANLVAEAAALAPQMVRSAVQRRSTSEATAMPVTPALDARRERPSRTVDAAFESLGESGAVRRTRHFKHAPPLTDLEFSVATARVARLIRGLQEPQ
jgi:hypothetical protein